MCTSLIQTYACECTKPICATPCFSAKKRYLLSLQPTLIAGTLPSTYPGHNPDYSQTHNNLHAHPPAPTDAQIANVTTVPAYALCGVVKLHSTPISRAVCPKHAGVRDQREVEGSVDWWGARGWKGFEGAMKRENEGGDWKEGLDMNVGEVRAGGQGVGVSGMGGLERSGSLISTFSGKEAL